MIDNDLNKIIIFLLLYNSVNGVIAHLKMKPFWGVITAKHTNLDLFFDSFKGRMDDAGGEAASEEG